MGNVSGILDDRGPGHMFVQRAVADLLGAKCTTEGTEEKKGMVVRSRSEVAVGLGSHVVQTMQRVNWEQIPAGSGSGAIWSHFPPSMLDHSESVQNVSSVDLVSDDEMKR